MPPLVLLLRGINVGGHGKVPMADLRAFLESRKFSNVRTLIQSGNVVCEGKPNSAATLEKALETDAQKQWGIPIDFFVRSASEWNAILAGNPFTREAKDAPNRLYVMLLKDAPRLEALTSLKSSIKGPEYFHSQGRELYLFYPDGMGQSKFTTNLIERKLNTRGTARNWNTLQKIAALLANP